MPRQVLRTTIEGHEFAMKQLGGDTADELMFRLGRGLAISDLSVADFNWAKKQFVELAQVGIVDTAIVDGEERGDGRTRMVPLRTVYDELFAGPEGRKIAGAFFKWAWEVNFGDFFGVIRSLLASYRTAPSSFTSPTAAAGVSGASSSPPAAS